MTLVNSLVRHFAKAFSTLLSETFQVVAPSCDAFRFFSSVLTSVSVLISLENNCCIFHHNSVIYLCCSLSTSTKKLDQASILGLPKPTFICRCAHIFGILFVVPDFFMSSTYTEKNDNCMLRSHLEIFSHRSSSKKPQIFLPIGVQPIR